MRSEGRHEDDVGRRPVTRLEGRRGEGADDLAVELEGHDQVRAELEQPDIPIVSVSERLPGDILDDPWLSATGHLAEPALVWPEDRQPCGIAVVHPGPRSDLKTAVSDDPQDGCVDVEDAKG